MRLVGHLDTYAFVNHPPMPMPLQRETSASTTWMPKSLPYMLQFLQKHVRVPNFISPEFAFSAKFARSAQTWTETFHQSDG
jgi:hypothetical protein